MSSFDINIELLKAIPEMEECRTTGKMDPSVDYSGSLFIKASLEMKESTLTSSFSVDMMQLVLSFWRTVSGILSCSMGPEY